MSTCGLERTYRVLSAFLCTLLGGLLILLYGGREWKLTLRETAFSKLSDYTNNNTTPRQGSKHVNETEFPVPNIVHYIWYEDQNQTSVFKFHQMISMISAKKILKPEVIYLHTNHEPTGPYWEKAKSVASVKVLHRTPPRTLYGEQTKLPAYQTSDSNIDRIKVLLEIGGIYLDTDVIVLRSFDELRKSSCALGYEMDDLICGGIIVGSKTSTFLYLWINSYLDDYRVDTWAYNSGEVPSKLSKRYPELVHIEPTRLHVPNWTVEGMKQIWGNEGFNWRDNYAVHLWYRLFVYNMTLYQKTAEPTSENIAEWKGAFGEIARYILEL